MNEEILIYLQKQIRTENDRLKKYTYNFKEQKNPKRFMFVKIENYVRQFKSKTSDNRLIIIPGFRGVGKSTVMAQLCSSLRNKHKTLFISVEDAKNLINAGIKDLIKAYEEILGFDLESAKEPIFIFLDEIQSDPEWATCLKTLFDRTSNVFICCSGSSAVLLQSTPNLARRAIFERMPPMCFTEYQMIKNNIFPIAGLKEKLNQAVYHCASTNEVYEKLKNFKPEVNQYWLKVNRNEIKNYLTFGSLPFALNFENETLVFDSILLLLDKIIRSDLAMLGNFDNATLSIVKQLLFVMAENDTTSLNKLEKKFKINRLTIAGVLEALEKAELLVKIPAYGSNMTAAKKPIKYLFMSPAVRMSFFYFTGLNSTYLTRLGKLFEDSVSSHLYREFIIKGIGAIRYDSAEGGADFILQILNQKQIIVEAGLGEKREKQVIKSMKKINCNYAIIFSKTELKADLKNKIVFVPLDYYFLM